MRRIRPDRVLTIGFKTQIDKNVPQKFRSEVLFRLAATGNLVLNLTRKNLTGQRSGRWYYKPGGGMYRASAPGEYPARRTGRLQTNVGTIWLPDEGRVVVGTTVPYGVHLERKSPSAGGRPWLGRSAADANPGVQSIWAAPWKLQ